MASRRIGAFPAGESAGWLGRRYLSSNNNLWWLLGSGQCVKSYGQLSRWRRISCPSGSSNSISWTRTREIRNEGTTTTLCYEARLCRREVCSRVIELLIAYIVDLTKWAWRSKHLTRLSISGLTVHILKSACWHVSVGPSRSHPLWIGLFRGVLGREGNCCARYSNNFALLMY